MFPIHRPRNLLIVLVVFLLSIGIAIVFTNKQGDVYEQYVRQVLYAAKGDAVPDHAPEYIDEQGVPYVMYKGENGIIPGKQYNPTIIGNYALQYLQQLQVGDTSVAAFFKACVDRLIKSYTCKDNFALYVFDWQQPWYKSVGVPYTSGMTSGIAIQVFTGAYKMYGDTSYLQHARKLLGGFYLPIQNGGFTYKTEEGWWFEELADTAMHTPYILDGHIYALLGVYQFATEAKDDSAMFVFNKGVQALKHDIALYDVGDGSVRYDRYGKLADKKYHRILTAQMKELAIITKDVVFEHYHHKWSQPLQKPYVLRVLGERNVSGILLLVIVSFVGFISFMAVIYFVK